LPTPQPSKADAIEPVCITAQMPIDLTAPLAYPSTAAATPRHNRQLADVANFTHLPTS